MMLNVVVMVVVVVSQGRGSGEEGVKSSLSGVVSLAGWLACW